MANTTNGIYYPDNYNDVADVLNDMKKLSESVDIAIKNIKIEETKQYNKIIELQNQNTELEQQVTQLEEENTTLKKQIPTGEASGNPIHISDSSDIECEIAVIGNAEQNGEPTPEVPVEITTVGNNVNLFDKDNANIVGLYIVKAGDTTLTQGTKAKSFYLECKPNTTYTIQKIAGKALAVGYTEEIPTTSSVLHGAIRNDSTSITITTGENAKYLVVYYNNGSESVTDQQLLDSIKVEIGSKATSYSQYGLGSSIIGMYNENYLNLENLSDQTKGGITLIKNDDGSYILNGTATSSFAISVPINLFLKRGTYTMITNNKYINGLYISLNNTQETMIGNNKNNSRTFVIDEDKIYTSYYIWINSGTQFNNFVIKPVLTHGTVLPDYTQSKSQIRTLPIQKEMLKIGDVEDTFIKQDGKWYEKHNFPKYVLNENTGFAIGATNDTYTRFYCANTQLFGSLLGKNTEVSCISEQLPATYFAGSLQQTNKECISTYAGRVDICILNSRLDTTETTTITALQNYLKDNPITFRAKSTPELIPCTPEQEEILNSFHTYKNVTNITASGIANLKVNYKKDQDTINKNNEARIAALEAAIVS